ncbi:Aminotransferase [Trypanosoma melophagium]|uniref:Aminotransferase n=1 Tax=Trypanosoma melophagium TaxID=715481 RepID=UPI00351A929D|nr:Aminotransferase [Trypanosoma melophagium]
MKHLSRVDISESNVFITNGTREGLNIAFQALLNPGDEVIVFEPYYDAYIHDIEMDGGVVAAHQTFCVTTPLQIGSARALHQAEGNDYYATLIAGYKERRDHLSEALSNCGLPPVKPSGGFFAVADISRVDPAHYYNPEDTAFAKDWQFCRWLVKTIGVCAIPVTAFCTPESRKLYEKYVCFAFCKTDDDIREAGVRLKKLQNYFLGV